jgi:ABC-2 type transport system permease protein
MKDPAAPADRGIAASCNRIGALLLRYYYILRSSPARIIDIMFWPAVQMILWGFISRFFAQRLGADPAALDIALGTLLGAVLLWDLLFRTQIAVFIAYLEEIWARNLGHLFISPLRAGEWWISMVLFSFFRVAVGLTPAVLLAIPFYGFSIFDLGLPLLAFFLNLAMMGWWLGFLVIAVLMRAGPGAEGLAWAFTFMIAPFCAVYYPVSVLPDWLQGVALALPATHVFEGLRALVEQGVFAGGHMAKAFGLNLLYLSISLFLLNISLKSSRRAGTLLQSGE